MATLEQPLIFSSSMINILNEAFAVELADMIEVSGVDYWIYGHHHLAIPEFKKLIALD